MKEQDFLFFFLAIKRVIFKKIYYKSYFVFTFFINLFILLFYFGCIGSLLLHAGFSMIEASGGYSSLRCEGFSLWWLLVAQHGL